MLAKSRKLKRILPELGVFTDITLYNILSTFIVSTGCSVQCTHSVLTGCFKTGWIPSLEIQMSCICAMLSWLNKSCWLHWESESLVQHDPAVGSFGLCLSHCAFPEETDNRCFRQDVFRGSWCCHLGRTSSGRCHFVGTALLYGFLVTESQN